MSDGVEDPLGRQAGLVVGVNLPWIEYGQDFGASAWRPRGGVSQPDRAERLKEALGALAASGARIVRWWLVADGRSGLRVDGRGRPLGLDEFFFADMDAAIDALRSHDLRVVFVLTDFLWFDAARLVNGVQMGGRGALVARGELRSGLMENVFAPIAARYAREPVVAGWDLLNEPDWVVFGLGTINPFHSISRKKMRAFFSDLVAVFRQGGASQPLTVGVARSSSLSLTEDLGLDIYQTHWYETADSVQTLAEPVASRALDRPLLLGEFPTAGASVRPERILTLAADAGYCGALAWSLLATDPATRAATCQTALAWAAERWSQSSPTLRA